MRKRYIQDSKTGKLVEAKLYRRNSHFIQGEIMEFISPLDGSVITSRKQLEEHNRRLGVTQDTFNEAYAAKQREREAYFSTDKPHDTARRRQALKFALESHQGSKTRAEIKEMAERYAADN